MNPYKIIKQKDSHSLPQIFEKFNVKNEREFCKAWFEDRKDVTEFFIESGFELPGEILDIQFDSNLKFGDGYLMPDILIHFEEELWYLEVMSTANNGKWDNDHHKQLYLKTLRLSQENPNLKTFAVSFKEFDACFVEEICKMDNTYAIHLIFNDEGYYADVVCKEEKQKVDSERREQQVKFWSEVISKNTFLEKRAPQKSDWMGKTISGVSINMKANGAETAAMLSFKKPVFDLYYSFFEKKELIENEFGSTLVWRETDKHREIRISTQPCFNDETRWSEGQSFLIKNAENFEKILKKFS